VTRSVPVPTWATESPTDRLVLEVVREEGEVTRASLAELTGIPKSTLTQHVGVLIRRGVLVEGPARAARRRGRPGTVLSLPGIDALPTENDSGRTVVLAVVLRHGSRFANGPVECALVAPDGVVHAARRVQADDHPIESAVAAAGDLLATGNSADVSVRTAVLGVPFPLVLVRDGRAVSESARIVPAFTHVLGSAPHLRLAEALEVPALIGNDADLGALAEGRWGWGRTVQDLLYVKCLSGIGVGVVKSRRVMTAGDITTGELEHMQVEGGGACLCGGVACRGGGPSRDGVLELHKRLHSLGAPAGTTGDLRQAIERRDPRTLGALRRVGEDIGRALAAMQVLWSPTVVALEAGLGSAHAPLAEGVDAGLSRWGLALRPVPVRVERSIAGKHAELMGAAAAMLTQDVPPPG
jgi:predicted NBD/HSP70 family sugar kinase/DNA-binding transcriptional ArsR family regulator